MKIWKWFGMDRGTDRTERNYDNNKHSTIQLVALCTTAVVVAAIIWL